MSLYQRKDSSYWWIKLTVMGRTIQSSTGTSERLKAQEYHDRLKVQLWEEVRLGRKPRRSWQDSARRWLVETSEKATHREDKVKLRWLHLYLGDPMLDEITLDVIDRIRTAKLKEKAIKATVNRYLALIRSILIRARDEWEWIDKVPKVRLFKEVAGRERSLHRNRRSGYWMNCLSISAM